MIRRVCDAAALNIGLLISHQMIVLAARVVQATHGRRAQPRAPRDLNPL